MSWPSPWLVVLISPAKAGPAPYCWLSSDSAIHLWCTMITGPYRAPACACTDCRRFWARHRSGEVTKPEIMEIEDNLAVTAGTCAVMGTASTMACLSEALGVSLPGSAAVPAVHADRLRIAEASGMQAVRLAASGLTLNQIVTRESIENALRVLLAIGGSTNAVIHLAAIAGRVGLSVDLHHLNRLSESTPILVNLKPTGQHYMEDFHAAGGVGAVLQESSRSCIDMSFSHRGNARERLRHPPGLSTVPSSAPGRPVFSVPEAARAVRPTLPPNGRFSSARRLLSVSSARRRAVVFRDLTDLSARIDESRSHVHPTMRWCCRAGRLAPGARSGISALLPPSWRGRA